MYSLENLYLKNNSPLKPCHLKKTQNLRYTGHTVKSGYIVIYPETVTFMLFWVCKCNVHLNLKTVSMQ